MSYSNVDMFRNISLASICIIDWEGRSYVDVNAGLEVGLSVNESGETELDV